MLRLATRTFLAVALALVVAAHAAAITAWDQAKVTEIAGNLESSVSNLQDAIRNSPAWTQSPQRTILFQIRDNLRWIENEATSLHAMLQKGETMESTLNSYRRIQMLRRDTQILAEKIQVTAFTQPALDRAKGALEQLAAYYPAEAANP